MTTSVGNNSVFRSFFEKQKHTAIPISAAQIHNLRANSYTEDLAAHAAWVKQGQREVASAHRLFDHRTIDIQRNLAHLGAYEYDICPDNKSLYCERISHLQAEEVNLVKLPTESYLSPSRQGFYQLDLRAEKLSICHKRHGEDHERTTCKLQLHEAMR
ncbi:hypothetical protein Tco_1546706 [Tanacetum coccineum]